MGPFKLTQNGNDHIVVMQHFTKWVEGCTDGGKWASVVADAVVQDWILNIVLSSFSRQ